MSHCQQQGRQLTAQLEMLWALGGSFCSCSSSSSVSVSEECDAKDFWAAILAEVTEGPRTDLSRWNCRHHGDAALKALARDKTM